MIFEQKQHFEHTYDKNLTKFLEDQENAQESHFLIREIEKTKSKIKDLTDISDDVILEKYRLKYALRIKESDGDKAEIERWLNGFVKRERANIPSKIKYLEGVLGLYKTKLKRRPNKSHEEGTISITQSEFPNFFRSQSIFESFKLYTKKSIVEHYIDYSYLFQRMIKENYIERITHKDFMKWLIDNKYISQNTYEKFLNREGFRSLNKSHSDYRANNFNNIFGQD